METNEPQPAQAEEPAPPPEPQSRSSAGVVFWRIVASLLILAALGASAWVWYDSRGRLGATQEELAKRLRAMEDDAREARVAAKAAQEAASGVQAKVGALEARLDEAQSQQAALESLYQELSRSRDEWQLAEVEQVLAIAQQQLQLSGNVRSALLALQLAEQRLARADRPQFQSIRRALARDIEQLKAAPTVDVAALSRRLDEVVESVDELPLASDARLQAAPSAPPPDPGPTGALERFAASLWRELKDLVVIRRVDAPEQPLLPPEQSYFLRENLRLRLLSARLALLARNAVAYQSDVSAAIGWLERHFDTDGAATREALEQLRALQQSRIRIEPPSITDSLEAVRSYKARRDRAPG